MLFKNKKGFTLVEISITLFIIATILIFAVPNYKDYNTRKDIMAMQSDAEMIETAINQYIMNGTVDEEQEKFNNLSTTPTMKVNYDNIEANEYEKVLIKKAFNKVNQERSNTINNKEVSKQILRLNNDLDDYFVITETNGEYKGKVFHKNGYLLENKYYNGLETFELK